MASDHILPVLDVLQKEMLLFASLCFLIGAIDDMVFDGLWIFYRLKRRLFVYSRYRRATVETLGDATPDGRLAIFVPAWNEAPVIGAMLERCLRQWRAGAYRIYVGCYPNDQATIAAVAAAAAGSRELRLVICRQNGPTTKADCLNHLWDALCQDEIEEKRNYAGVVLHDAEDLVHPEELRLLRHLVSRAALVQLPVIPRRATRSRWIAGHYGDEFAELHGKQMVMREALGASMPSAGVGCAFARDALMKLSARTQGKPFDAQSMTEDYELGLKLTEGDSRGIFVRLRDQRGQLVATQEFFPDKLADAVRQKSRWIAGISLSGWDRLGWNKGWRENWMRLRDRKATIAAMVLAIAYMAVILTAIMLVAEMLGFYQLQPVSEFLGILLVINAGALIWRQLLKSCFVFALYGLREALLSMPRTVVANIINIMAAWRAIGHYTRQLVGDPVNWEKTAHFFPDANDVQELRPKFSVGERN
ncbi:glycosyl transferase family protein [Parasphingorhabdus flavimaris]|uniref:Glycosyl transferase family protein n=1 Tax=Parasphingorhabdus flavimaris TaxID=266812 RepID=A0ABX2MXZ9_9SPHN|nr:glycosyl transferase family protein [Parasphingorhabdus flavimaris]NVD26327.1 glycosyl transferase family protein [Parasphingorhabdus flavimaris]